MQKQTRRALFYFLVLLFSAATPFIILYALGYIPDIASWRLTPTGGFFVKTNEYGIRVSVNGRVEKETGFLARGALVTNLPPGIISAEVTKEGFYPWRKSIEIEKQVVQEFPSVLLIPASLDSLIVAGTTTTSTPISMPRAILPNPAGRYLIWATESGEKTSIRVIDRSSGGNSKSPISLDEGEEYEHAAWNANGTAFIFISAQNGRRWYYSSASGGKPELLFGARKTISITESATSTIPGPLNLKLSNIKQIAWDPSSPARLLLFDGEKLHRWNRQELFVQPIIEDAVAFAAFPDEIFFISKGGFLNRAGLDGSGAAILDRPGFFMNDSSPPQIIRNDNSAIFVIDSGGRIYALERETNKLILAAANIELAKFSRARNLLGYTEGGKLIVRFLEDEKRQPFRSRNSNHQILDAVVPINDFIWFGKDASHIIFTTKDGVFITETDSRFGANATTLKTGQFIVSEDPNDTNSFYLTNGQTLERVTLD